MVSRSEIVAYTSNVEVVFRVTLFTLTFSTDSTPRMSCERRLNNDASTKRRAKRASVRASFTARQLHPLVGRLLHLQPHQQHGHSYANEREQRYDGESKCGTEAAAKSTRVYGSDVPRVPDG